MPPPAKSRLNTPHPLSISTTIKGLEGLVDLGIHYRENVDDDGDNRPYLALDVSLCRQTGDAKELHRVTFLKEDKVK